MFDSYFWISIFVVSIFDDNIKVFGLGLECGKHVNLGPCLGGIFKLTMLYNRLQFHNHMILATCNLTYGWCYSALGGALITSIINRPEGVIAIDIANNQQVWGQGPNVHTEKIHLVHIVNTVPIMKQYN